MVRPIARPALHRFLLVSLFSALTAGPAHADIYKSIGPDGKMVVSNVAPVGKAGQVMVLKSAAPAPRRVQAVYSNAGTDTLRPDVVGAVANVMGMSHLVISARDFCIATSPAAVKRYSDAAIAWQLRNATVVAKKNRILAMSDRGLVASALSGDMLRLTDDMMRPVRQAGTAERIKWCDKTIQDVDRGMLDLVGRASIAPLMNYSLR
jgi:hypothetical protein